MKIAESPGHCSSAVIALLCVVLTGSRQIAAQSDEALDLQAVRLRSRGLDNGRLWATVDRPGNSICSVPVATHAKAECTFCKFSVRQSSGNGDQTVRAVAERSGPVQFKKARKRPGVQWAALFSGWTQIVDFSSLDSDLTSPYKRLRLNINYLQQAHRQSSHRDQPATD